MQLALYLTLLCFVTLMQLDLVASNPIKKRTVNDCYGTGCSVDVDYYDSTCNIHLLSSINDSVAPALPEIIELMSDMTNHNELVSLIQKVVMVLSPMAQTQQDTHQQLINMMHLLQQQLGQVEPQSSPEPELLSSPKPELQTSPEPEFQTSPQPELQTSPEPKLQTSTEHELPTSPEPELQTSPQPELQTSPEPKLQTSTEPELQTSPEPKFPTSPESELPTSAQLELQTNAQPELQTSPQPELQTSPEHEIQTNQEPELKTSLDPKLQTIAETELRKSAEPELQTSPQIGLQTKPEPELTMDCSNAPSTGQYTISPEHGDPNPVNPFPVVCDMDTTPGGWIIIQRRFDGSVSFDRNWADYENGFGSLDGEFWLGLSKIHLLTSRGSWKLRVDLEDFDDDHAYAEYDYFQVGNRNSFYRLAIRDYSGTAGDAMTITDFELNGLAFTTKDQDHDQYPYENKAIRYKSGWWHRTWAMSNVNGLYLGEGSDHYTGIYWWWKHGTALKKTELKIRSSN